MSAGLMATGAAGLFSGKRFSALEPTGLGSSALLWQSFSNSSGKTSINFGWKWFAAALSAAQGLVERIAPWILSSPTFSSNISHRLCNLSANAPCSLRSICTSKAQHVQLRFEWWSEEFVGEPKPKPGLFNGRCSDWNSCAFLCHQLKAAIIREHWLKGLAQMTCLWRILTQETEKAMRTHLRATTTHEWYWDAKTSRRLVANDHWDIVLRSL